MLIGETAPELARERVTELVVLERLGAHLLQLALESLSHARLQTLHQPGGFLRLLRLRCQDATLGLLA